MRILITGAGGFVGKNLVEGLKEKYVVLAPRSSELNLTNYKAVERYISNNQITHIVHAAVHSGLSLSREDGFQKDLRMFVSLIRNLDKLQKLIVFGSGAEFAKTRDMKKVTEDEWGKYVPEDLYGLSKFLTTEIVRREPKMINLRLFGIYGPHEDYRYKFISNAIVKNLLGLPIAIKQDVVFDYLYVTDLIPVVEYFLTHKSMYSDYNVSTTESIKLSEIVKIVNKISSKPMTIDVIEKGLNYQYTGDNKRLREELPRWNITSYLSGIKSLYGYYQQMKDQGKLDRSAIINDDYLKQAKTTKRKL